VSTTFGYESRIVEELHVMATPIDDVQPHPDNARKHRVEKIAQSLTAHGQRSPLVIQKSTGYVVKGNGTWQAAKLLGWNHLAMSFQEMSDETALAYLLADNRASDLSTYDAKKLSKALNLLADGPGLMDSLWDTSEAEDIHEEAGGSSVLPDAGDSGVTQTVPEKEGKADAAPAAKMKEIPIVLTAADHAVFLNNLATLKKFLGVTRNDLAIIEAVSRQATAEAESGPVTGQRMSDHARAVIIHDWAEEFRAVLNSVPAEVNRATVNALLDQMAPMPETVVPASDVVPGQVAMDELPGTGKPLYADPDPDPVPAPEVEDTAPGLAEEGPMVPDTSNWPKAEQPKDDDVFPF